MTQQPSTPPGGQPMKRLIRTRDDRYVAGVCGGLARYFGVDPTLVRVIVVVATLFGALLPAIGYLVAWAIVPAE